MAKLRKQVSDLRIEDASLIFKNFAGKQDEFNTLGKKKASLVITDLELVEVLRADGWSVKNAKPNPDTGEVDRAFLSFEASYKNRPPKVIMITGRTKTPLTESTIGMLDWADIKKVDVVLSPYHYDVLGKTGISAYLKTMYVVVEEDPFDAKYDFDDYDTNNDLPFE